jgi:hypothetical protein
MVVISFLDRDEGADAIVAVRGVQLLHQIV